MVLLVIASAASVSSQNKVYNGRADLNVAKSRLSKATKNKYSFWLAYFRASGESTLGHADTNVGPKVALSQGLWKHSEGEGTRWVK